MPKSVYACECPFLVFYLFYGRPAAACKICFDEHCQSLDIDILSVGWRPERNKYFLLCISGLAQHWVHAQIRLCWMLLQGLWRKEGLGLRPQKEPNQNPLSEVNLEEYLHLKHHIGYGGFKFLWSSKVLFGGFGTVYLWILGCCETTEI